MLKILKLNSFHVDFLRIEIVSKFWILQGNRNDDYDDDHYDQTIII